MLNFLITMHMELVSVTSECNMHVLHKIHIQRWCMYCEKDKGYIDYWVNGIKVIAW